MRCRVMILACKGFVRRAIADSKDEQDGHISKAGSRTDTARLNTMTEPET